MVGKSPFDDPLPHFTDHAGFFQDGNELCWGYQADFGILPAD